MREIIYISHRGYSGQYPENTMLAFDKAIEEGFKGVEFDVHLSKDGHPVIIHDEEVDRTAADGSKGFVKDLTLEELRKIDFKWKFENAPRQTIMTLGEWCERYYNKFKLINLEIKTDEIEYKGLEEIVWDTIKPYINKSDATWVISSFNLKTAQKWIKMKTGVPAAFLYEYLFQFEDVDNIEEFGFLHPSSKAIVRSPLGTYEDGVTYNVWTVNTKEMYKDIMDLAKKYDYINGMITNYKVWEGEFGPIQKLSEFHQKRDAEWVKKEEAYLKKIGLTE